MEDQQPIEPYSPMPLFCIVVLLGLFAAFGVVPIIGSFDGMTLDQPSAIAEK